MLTYRILVLFTDKFYSSLLLLLVFTTVNLVSALLTHEIVIVVISQGDSYNAKLAHELRADIHHQAYALGQSAPKVYLTHEDIPHHEAWTITPILPILNKYHGNSSSWFIFCEERTRFNLGKLVIALSKHDHSKNIWLGHGLVDREPSIVHHFEYNKRLQYPLMAAGFAVSNAMLRRIIRVTDPLKSVTIAVDPSFELTLLIAIPMLSLPFVFCFKKDQNDCATYPLPFSPCGKSVPNEDIYFAVKTCLKFHRDRVPVVQQTWGRDAAHIEFFSHVRDESIPTTSVDVANTEFGHCQKTLAILKIMLKRTQEMPNLQWVVLADDDTLLSVPRIRSFLSCWTREPVVVGERYGLNVTFGRGYKYLTLGAGVAFSVAVLPSLVKYCHCEKPTSPDDMVLGKCMARLNISLVHSPFFHQGRPADYSYKYLASQFHVSFHKHWMLDPIYTYQEWFSSDSLHILLSTVFFITLLKIYI